MSSSTPQSPRTFTEVVDTIRRDNLATITELHDEVNNLKRQLDGKDNELFQKQVRVRTLVAALCSDLHFHF